MKRYTMIRDRNYNGHDAVFMYDADDYRLVSDEPIWKARRDRDLSVVGEVATFDRRHKIATLVDGRAFLIHADRSAEEVSEEAAAAHRRAVDRERAARKAAQDAYNAVIRGA